MSDSLPDNWAVVPLKNLILPTETLNPATDRKGNIRYIDIEAVDNRRQEITNPKVIPASAAPSRARRKLLKHDVIFSLVRPYLKNLAIIPEELNGEIASTAFYVSRLGEGIASEWLYQHLCRDSVINALPTVGSSPPATRDVDFEEHHVRIPPTKEQHRILSVLEHTLAKIDEAEDALMRVTQNLDRYRASVLKAACEGRLVPNEAEIARKEGRDFEPASKLLERILIARREVWEKTQLEAYAKKDKTPPKDWKSRYPEPLAPDSSELPDLPDGWCWASIDQLVIESIRTGLSIKADADSGGVRSLRLDSLRGKHLDLTRWKRLPIDQCEVENLGIVEGDFFVSRGNGSLQLLASGAAAHGIDGFIIFPDIMFRLRFSSLSITNFVTTIWNSSHIRSQVKSAAKSTSGVYKITKSCLEKFVVPLPPKYEAGKIVERVSKAEALIEKIASSCAQRLLSCHTLRQSFLKHAFSGKLVPQDPTDEPASVLLDRIRAQRSELEVVSTPRKHAKRKSNKTS